MVKCTCYIRSVESQIVQDVRERDVLKGCFVSMRVVIDVMNGKRSPLECDEKPCSPGLITL